VEAWGGKDGDRLSAMHFRHWRVGGDAPPPPMPAPCGRTDGGASECCGRKKNGAATSVARIHGRAAA